MNKGGYRNGKRIRRISPRIREKEYE